jgi:hypothetical protein
LSQLELEQDMLPDKGYKISRHLECCELCARRDEWEERVYVPEETNIYVPEETIGRKERARETFGCSFWSI